MTFEKHERRLPRQIRERLGLIIFDLDGVITDERIYWDAARLTLWEIIEGDNALGLKGYFGFESGAPLRQSELRDRITRDRIIYELKRRAINSNWDKTFVLMAFHLMGVIGASMRSSSDDRQAVFSILGKEIPLEQKLYELGRRWQDREYRSALGAEMMDEFLIRSGGLTGSDLLNNARPFACQRLGLDLDLLEPRGGLWHLCHRIFQEFYEGRRSIPNSFRLEEETIIDSQRIAATLAALSESGKYRLGIATGRPLDEAIGPLRAFGLLKYFDFDRVVTANHVLEAERVMSRTGQEVQLGKPHPFAILRAIYPDASIELLCQDNYGSADHRSAAVVGDSSSDIIAAKKANCIAIGVLTGMMIRTGPKESQELMDLGCDIVLESIFELPRALGLEIEE